MPPVSAGPVTISPARLEISLDASPASLIIGQDIAVKLTVRNSGTVAAQGVSPSIAVRGTGSASLQSGPTPANADLAPGATQDFEWTWRAAARGAVTFEASAAGTDAVSGNPVASGLATAGPIVIGQRAQLSGVLVAPNYVAAGAAFDVRLDLTNSGDTRAVAVTPTAPLFGGTAAASVSSGPTPASVDVPAGGTASLQWTVQPTSEGSLTLIVSASGTDASDGLPVLLGDVGASVAVGIHASLKSELTAPSLVAPGASFTLTLTVTNSGAADASAVTPTAVSTGGTAGLTVSGAPTPAQADIAAGASASFRWTLQATAAGLANLAAGATGTEQPSGQALVAPAAHASLEIAEAQRLLADPFGDGTSASFLFGYRGHVYVGPRQDGSGAVRFHADGSNPESVTFALQRDPVGPSTSTNTSSAPYPGFGAPGCARNTGACGPDNENGRPFFTSAAVFGDEWLFGAGATSGADRLHRVYLTNEAGPALSFPYADLSPALENDTLGVSAVHAFKDRVYIGLPDNSSDRPFLVAMLVPPASPGLDAALDTDVLHLDGGVLPDIGAWSGNNAPVQIIDSMVDFNDRLYLFNNGGCARSTTATPRPAGVAPNDWTSCTSTHPDWTRKASITTSKTSGIEPADKAVPQAAVWQDRLYSVRNTTTGPQLWRCTPSLKADGLACDPKRDWSQVAKNTTGDLRLSQFNDPRNAAATLLVATPSHLYVGFDNGDGLALYRTSNASPSAASDFQGLGGCSAPDVAGCAPFGGHGLGDVGAKRIYGAVTLSYGGRGYLYVLAGDGSGPLRVFRVDE
ncbi:MAG: CARDB domain-containing protein [Myxococcales bacterium]